MIGAISKKTYGLRLKTFRPKLRFSISIGHFTVKTVDSTQELKKALELRYNIFYKELLNKNKFIRLDVDKFDFIADHIIIIDNKTKIVVGTYRVISSTFSDRFYSQTEFDISGIKLLKATKLEIGRASVHKDYRNGTIITLLWKGISQYAKLTEAKYVFGCASIQTDNIMDITLAYKYLKQFESPITTPLENYRIKNLNKYMKSLGAVDINLDSLKSFVPSLIHAYLKAGASICGEPAYDKDFRCVDFITLLDANSISASFSRKFR